MISSNIRNSGVIIVEARPYIPADLDRFPWNMGDVFPAFPFVHSSPVSIRHALRLVVLEREKIGISLCT